MMEIFKWGVSIFLSLCGISTFFILAALTQAYPDTIGVALGVGTVIISLLFLVGVGAYLIHIWLFE